jgi:hypothetical protein
VGNPDKSKLTKFANQTFMTLKQEEESKSFLKVDYDSFSNEKHEQDPVNY